MQAFELKGTMTKMFHIKLKTFNFGEIRNHLDSMTDETENFFEGSLAILEFQKQITNEKFKWNLLREIFSEYGLQIIGVKNLSEEFKEQVLDAHLAWISSESYHMLEKIDSLDKNEPIDEIQEIIETPPVLEIQNLEDHILPEQHENVEHRAKQSEHNALSNCNEYISKGDSSAQKTNDFSKPHHSSSISSKSLVHDGASTFNEDMKSKNVENKESVKNIKDAVQQMRSITLDKPLRSGQQFYAKGCDLIVTAMVSPGAEVIADGNIHIYAPLRGRALAGARGDQNARIFTTCMEAELVSIAGIYKNFADGVPSALENQPAMISLIEKNNDVEMLVNNLALK